MIAPPAARLGVLPHDPARLAAVPVLPRVADPVPKVVGWFKNTSGWTLAHNDRIGDCVPVAAANAIRVMSAARGDEVIPSDEWVVDLYRRLAGYDPARPETDTGLRILDMLDYWAREGLPMNDDEPNDVLLAFWRIRVGRVAEAIWRCGAVIAAVALPVSAIDQEVWTLVAGPDAAPGSWGLHGITVVGADPLGLWAVTWGERKRLTWSWWSRYATQEVYALGSALFSGPVELAGAIEAMDRAERAA